MFHGRRKAIFFEKLINKIARRIRGWQNKFLSNEGKQILINHVLTTIPIYLLSMISPPKKTLNQIHKMFVSFFWSKIRGAKGKHWVKWEDLCFPYKEGGVGFKFLHDIAKALFVKLWWKFRTFVDTMWSSFMWNKYCKKLHHLLAPGRGGSHV